MKINKKVEAQEKAWQLEQQQKLAAGKSNKRGKAGTASGIAEDAVEVNVAGGVKEGLIPDHSAKVAELKRLIEDGQYKPDSQKVAQALSDAVEEEIVFARLANDKG